MKKVIVFGVNLELVAKLSENSNFRIFGMRIDELGGEHSAALQHSLLQLIQCSIKLILTEKWEFGILPSRCVLNLKNQSRV